MIKDIFKDILRHTHALGFIEMVKISGTAESTTIEAMDADKTVILQGKLHNPVADFVDHTVGLSRMSVLHGYLQFPGFTSEDGNVEVVTQARNGVDIPVEISFSSAEGHSGSYRFMLADVINQQLKSVTMKDIPWDVTIVPTQKNLKDINNFNGILGGFEPVFSPTTESGALYFHIGEGAGDKVKLPINNNVDGELSGNWKWETDKTLSILRLSDSANCTVSFANAGAMQIVIDSGLGEYTYILPAKS
tara:strand:- start:502 stop:1245 length:744 start_codon:yes stop_codon:yes gene_type:complete